MYAKGLMEKTKQNKTKPKPKKGGSNCVKGADFKRF
jgi:hypothetical protein